MAHAPRSTEVPPRRAVLPALLALVLATGTGPVPASDPDGLAARTAPAAPAKKATVRFEMLATNHIRSPRPGPPGSSDGWRHRRSSGAGGVR